MLRQPPFKYVAIIGLSILSYASSQAQTYDITDEAHFPDITMPFDSSMNPLPGNVWTYGFRDTGAGGVNQVMWNDNSFDIFTPFDRFEHLGADVIGGEGSFGDINTMCEQSFVSCAAGGNGGAQVKIVDYGSGPAAHVVAGVDSFVKGTVHLFTDDDAPTDRAAIVRFTPPVPGDYEIDVLFENRANSGFASDAATYHAVVARGGGPFETFDVLSEGFLGPQAFNGNLGLGNGAFVVVNQTVTLGENDHIELAAMGSGAFPGVPIAVVGTISLVTMEDQPGDFNEDGVVDAADYVNWRKTLMTPAEYTTWVENFGEPGTSGGGGTVPEPGTFAIVILVTAIGAARSRR